ncbi:MAG TPA: aldo/keto reductase [Opitutaceae bacterium]|nr:aldo/keto reductase [Opitutaceae bacterium]
MPAATLSGIFPRAEGLRAAVTLNNGVRMPWFGLGVFQIAGDSATETVVRMAIAQGYRSIDTAALYANERGVGRAIRGAGVPRAELFVTTKVWNDDMRRDRVEAAFEQSLRRLGLDYIDLFLLHWPIAGKITTSWQALEKLHRAGKIKAIGVSNFMPKHLDELLAAAEVVPAVNQIEFHPYLQSKALADQCRAKGIQLEAWSPLMQGGALLRDPALAAIAAAHGKTVAQIVLRWDVQGGVVTIPKSVQPRRLAENAGIFDFSLTDAEMAAIAALDRNQRSGADPYHFNF